jgi:hypothetical protein
LQKCKVITLILYHPSGAAFQKIPVTLVANVAGSNANYKLMKSRSIIKSRSKKISAISRTLNLVVLFLNNILSASDNKDK